MNDAVKKRIEQMKELADQIIEKAELLKGDADDVETDEDLYVVELAFDSIIGWAKEGYDVCRNTYDEFEERG